MNQVRAVLLALAVPVLAGCAAADKLLGILPTTPLARLQVIAQPAANADSATAIDIVFVFDDTAKAMLPRTGPEWFANKPALLAGLALSLQVVSLQVPPASAAEVPLTSRLRKAVAVYSYANYIPAAGQAVGNLTPFQCVQVLLEPATVSYRNCS